MKTRRELVKFFGIGYGGLATFIYDCVREHPQTVVPKINTNFFSSSKQFAKGIDWYERNFCFKGKNEKGGELANNYLRHPDSAELIAKNYPDARLLAVIDNPLLAIKVDYLRAKKTGSISTNVTIEDFVSMGGDKFLHRYFFGHQLANYFSLYSPTDLMVVLISDFKNTQLKIIREIYEHLGLDKEFIPTALKYLVINEDDEDVKKKNLIKKSIKSIKVKLKKLIVFIFHKVKTKKQKIGLEIIMRANQLNFSSEMETFLKNYYRQDIRMLSNLLHRDLNDEWGI